MMEEFDWVAHRAACSAAPVFESLKAAVKKDTEQRDELESRKPQDSPRYRFEFQANGDTFSVIRKGPGVGNLAVVKFCLLENSISVERNDHPLLEGFVTLSDDRNCRLKVNAVELELWQFRKRALEDLFFKAK